MKAYENAIISLENDERGIQAVEALKDFRPEGNVIPPEWFVHLKLDNGKPDVNAILVLAELMYWYRPTQVIDEETGEIEYRKRFKADLLQKSYQQLAEKHGFSKKQITEAMTRLEKRGIIERVFRTIKTPSVTLNNVLFIVLHAEKVKQLQATGRPYPIPLGEGLSYSIGRPSPPGGREGLSLQGETYTKTTTKITSLEKDARASDPCKPVKDPISGFCKTASLKEEKIPKGKKGTRLQDDWTLPDKWRDWSIQCGMMNEEIDMIELKFRNYWLSTTKNSIKKDWFLTWQNWCVREYERKGISLKVKNTVLAEKQAPPKNIPIEQSADPRIQKWNELQPMLREKVNTYANGAYESWLAPSTRNIKLISANGKAIFEVKNPWYAEKIKLQYREDLVDVLRMIDPKLGVEQNIEFVIQSE